MKNSLVSNLSKVLFLSILLVFLGLSFGVFFQFSFPSAQANEGQKTGTGDFVVGMECNYQPFDWQTSKPTKTSISIGSAGYCDGYDVIIARKISNEIGKNLNVKKISWEGLQPALESGVIDTIISGVTATPERQKGMDFTTSYYSSEMVMLVRKDSPESKFNSISQFSGLTVISQKNTTYDEVIDQIKGVKHGVPKDTFSVLAYALQNYQTNGVTCELPVAQGIVRSNSNLGIVKFSEGQGFLADTNVSIAFAKGAAQT
ncbi:MAG: transporter substrate-binding domain-containing protein, partial [Bifidobacteriaceae bacterium]|nr:transporter substrate-binding domain-containing protein [Bifidobacteriaceae bacterium]